jgi:urease accessory protein
MSGTPLPSDDARPRATGIDGVRVAGGVNLRLERRHGRTSVADLLERDGYKVRFPRERSEEAEAVIINTGGGLAGGDQVHQHIELGDGARATISTQSSERVYRALGDSETCVDVRLSIGADATLNWLPQETILFDRSRLRRSIEIDIAASSKVLIAETIVFGRTAMGETVRNGLLTDRWRIRCDGKLIFAENVLLDGEIAERLAATPIARGAHVVSTLLAIRQDAADLLGPVRAALGGADCEAGASAWGPRLAVRTLGRSSEGVRRLLARVIPILTGRALPRVWQT